MFTFAQTLKKYLGEFGHEKSIFKKYNSHASSILFYIFGLQWFFGRTEKNTYYKFV